MKIRAIVPVYNEEKLLPKFLRHYARLCDSIVVWDNGSTDRTFEIASAHPLVEARRFETDGYDELSVLSVLEATKDESRGRYDWCLFPDCDEFIMGDVPGTERDTLSRSKADILAPRGYCLAEVAGDPPLDLGADILRQRRNGYPSPAYSKPVVMRPEAVASFAPGKHSIRGIVASPEPGLLLVHCEMVDFALWTYRKNRRPLSRRNVEHGWSVRRFCRSTEEHQRIWEEAQHRSISLDGVLPKEGI